MAIKSRNQTLAKPVRSKRNRYRDNPRRGDCGSRFALVGFFAALWGAVKVVFSGVFVLVFLGGLSISLIAGYHYVTHARYFQVKKVVLSGLERTTREEVLKQTGLDEPCNILALRLGAMAARLRDLPWVKDVTVTRRLPDTIMIKVLERKTNSLVLLDSLYYLDETGLPIGKVESGENPELPIVTGFSRADFTGKQREFSLRDMREVFALLEVLAERNDGFGIMNISEVNFDSVRGLTLFTREENVQVKIGVGDYEAKLKRLGRVLAHIKINGQEDGLTYFNLECSPRVIVRKAASG